MNIFSKPLKTRIKKVTTADGTVRHYAQYKYLFSWYNFSDWEVTVWSHTTPRSVWGASPFMDEGSLEECKMLIDQYIEAYNAAVEKQNKKKVVNTEYIKYP